MKVFSLPYSMCTIYGGLVDLSCGRSATAIKYAVCRSIWFRRELGNFRISNCFCSFFGPEPRVRRVAFPSPVAS